MSADTLIDTVRRAGGVLKLEGENVKCWLPTAAAHLTSQLKECKPELIAVLKANGGRIAVLPHCPSCASYALYRQDNVGLYECLTCGLLDIEEAIARRLV